MLESVVSSSENVVRYEFPVSDHVESPESDRDIEPAVLDGLIAEEILVDDNFNTAVLIESTYMFPDNT